MHELRLTRTVCRVLSFLRRRRLSRRADAALATVLVALGQWQVWAGWADGGVGTPTHHYRAARALLVILFSAPLAWRRRRPLTVAAVICGALTYQLVAVVAYVPFLVGLAPMAIANYTVAAYASRWRLASLAFVFATESVIFAKIPAERVSGEVLFAAFVALGTWVVGDVVRARSNRAQRALDDAQVLMTRSQAATAAALADERARIARELHDVIAHSVSVMGVQAGAARTLIGHDPEAARAALLQVEATARSSVEELQRLLAVLRDDDDTGATRTPQPGLAQLDDLVAQVRAAGLDVCVTADEALQLSPGLDLAAFRIIQEALTNALKHAGTPTQVSVERNGDDVTIEVTNSGPTAGRDSAGGAFNGAGHGLIGMRERVQLYGGSLQAQRQPDGGFIVHAVLPAATESALDPVP